MKKIHLLSKIVNTIILCLILIAFCNIAKADDPPFTVLPGLFDQSNQDSLGLTTAEGTETITVFSPGDSTDHYSNGVVMTVFKGWFYCQWQSSAQDEDAPDTWVAYSRSQDGKNWSPPDTLAPTIEAGFRSSGGWWVAGDTLVAYINVWPSDVSPRGGYTCYITSTDGLTWSEIKPLPMADADTLKGIFEQDPHALPDGRIINAAHFQPGLIAAPIYTDDPSGVRGWTRASFTNLSVTGGISREIEPSWFLRSDDTIVMTFRDQNSTYFRLASVSGDRGESWSTPVLTNMPDSKAKQSAGNLPDGTAFMVGNPVDNKTRIPLVVTLGKDGKLFNTAYVLRKGGEGIQDLRYTGTSKRLGYHYPKSIVWNEYLYVSYATNKEDVEYTRVPLASLILDTTTVVSSLTTLEISNIEIYFGAGKVLRISLPDYYGEGTVSIYNINGQLLYHSEINSGEVYYDMNHHPAGLYIIDVSTGLRRETRLINKW